MEQTQLEGLLKLIEDSRKSLPEEGTLAKLTIYVRTPEIALSLAKHGDAFFKASNCAVVALELCRRESWIRRVPRLKPSVLPKFLEQFPKQLSDLSSEVLWDFYKDTRRGEMDCTYLKFEYTEEDIESYTTVAPDLDNSFSNESLTKDCLVAFDIVSLDKFLQKRFARKISVLRQTLRACSSPGQTIFCKIEDQVCLDPKKKKTDSDDKFPDCPQTHLHSKEVAEQARTFFTQYLTNLKTPKKHGCTAVLPFPEPGPDPEGTNTVNKTFNICGLLLKVAIRETLYEPPCFVYNQTFVDWFKQTPAEFIDPSGTPMEASFLSEVEAKNGFKFPECVKHLLTNIALKHPWIDWRHEESPDYYNELLEGLINKLADDLDDDHPLSKPEPCERAGINEDDDNTQKAQKYFSHPDTKKPVPLMPDLWCFSCEADDNPDRCLFVDASQNNMQYVWFEGGNLAKCLLKKSYLIGEMEWGTQEDKDALLDLFVWGQLYNNSL